MQLVALTMPDGSVKRMQVVDGADIDEAVAKLPWPVISWRLALPKEFPANSKWRDEGGKIVGTPIVAVPVRNALAELDALKATLITKGSL